MEGASDSVLNNRSNKGVKFQKKQKGIDVTYLNHQFKNQWRFPRISLKFRRWSLENPPKPNPFFQGRPSLCSNCAIVFGTWWRLVLQTVAWAENAAENLQRLVEGWIAASMQMYWIYCCSFIRWLMQNGIIFEKLSWTNVHIFFGLGGPSIPKTSSPKEQLNMIRIWFNSMCTYI